MRWAAADESAKEKEKFLLRKDAYTLGFVEFDEAGDFRHRKHVIEVVSDLYNTATAARNRGKKILLFAYIHGWQNNLRSADVQNFERFLSELAQTDTVKSEEFEVYGVYFGWRGRLVPTPDDLNDPVSKVLDNFVYAVPKLVSFWTREAAAERVAKFSSTEALLWFVKAAYSGSKGSRAVFVGHSFGGLVLEEAIAQALLSRLLDPAGKDRDVSAPADLVVLLNQAAPAFGAKRLQQAIASVTKTHAATRVDPERPLIVSITSEGDRATRLAFPFARWMGSMFSSGRKYNDPEEPPLGQHSYMRMTAGHLPALWTHRITFEGSSAAVDTGASPQALAEPVLVDPITSTIESVGDRLNKIADSDSSDVQPRPAIVASLDNALARAKPLDLDESWKFESKNSLDGGRIRTTVWDVQRTGTAKWKTPYWIISSDRKFIGGHGDVWNSGVRFFILNLLNRSDALSSIQATTLRASPTVLTQ